MIRNLWQDLARRANSAALGMVARGVLLVSIPCATTVQATVIFSQPVDAGAVGFISDFGGDAQEADNFVLGSPAVLGTVRWWGGYDSNDVQTDSFVIRLFDDNGAGLPQIDPFLETPAAPTRQLTGLTDPLGADLYLYSSELAAGVPLAGGTVYYLSIVNDTSAGNWFWALDGIGNDFSREADGLPWEEFPTDGNHAFELSAVPEPTTASLWGIGALWLFLLCTHRRRSTAAFRHDAPGHSRRIRRRAPWLDHWSSTMSI
jgi:hypothetical protein